MRAVIQRVTNASVTVDSNKISTIGQGLMVLIGVGTEDTDQDIDKVATKIATLRLFPNEQGDQEWRRSVCELNDGKGGEVLCVSQFTLHAKIKKGTKPDFHRSGKGEYAKETYDKTLNKIGALIPGGRAAVKDGQFGAMMNVGLVNDGPVTIVFDTKDMH